MVVGTNPYAGKSLINYSYLSNSVPRGWRVAPFKGQNMALNAYVTASGGEIGYAQAVQAWAAGVVPLGRNEPNFTETSRGYDFSNNSSKVGP